jgi:hypothetical protein
MLAQTFESVVDGDVEAFGEDAFGLLDRDAALQCVRSCSET